MSSYYEKQTKYFLGNLLEQYPDFISNDNTTDLWYTLLTTEEKHKLSAEIANYLTHTFDSEEKLSHIAVKKRGEIKDSSLNLIRYIESQDSTSEKFSEFECLSKHQKSKIAQILQKCLHTSSQMQTNAEEGSDAIIEVKEIFKLSDIETLIVNLFYCAEVYRDLENLVEDSRNNTMNIRIPNRSIQFISKIVGITQSEAAKCFKKNSPLMKYGILHERRDLNLSSDITEFLSGTKEGGLIEKYSKQIDLNSALPLESFQVNASSLEILKTILESNSPCSILFHGKPGTGKTELTKAIAKAINSNLFSSKILDEEGEDDNNNRKRSLFAIQNHPAFNNSIIVIDECDNLINARPNFLFKTSHRDEKGWINEYLDINKCKLIWITNTLSNVDDSTLRRFNYILEFDTFTNTQREKVLKSIASNQATDFLSEEDIKLISKMEKLSTGHFSIAFKTVENMNVTDDKKNAYFKSILNEHLKSLGSTPLRLKGITNNYCINGLNIDQSPQKIIEQSRKILEQIETSDVDLNLNVLLYGPPGTGKTEFVKYLGQEIGKEIILKRASDLLSMWVGGSEKNIRKAFEDAENEKKILFIDEADSLLSPREGHNRTWETTQVNEILTCMENFRGILICATNHVDNLDMAAKRRFLFKLKFDYLNSNGVLHFYAKFFSRYLFENISQTNMLQLSSIQGLTPSDFNNLKRKFDIVPPQSHEEIIEQLILEISYKKNLFKSKVGIG